MTRSIRSLLLAALAVSGKQVVAAGSLDEVKRALGALCLSTEVIAPEEWALPGRTFQAATTPAGYLARLRAAEMAMKGEDGWPFSWGYHQLWHGKLDRKTLDGVSATRPIFVWHRSVHEFFLNSAAIRALGLDESAMMEPGALLTAAPRSIRGWGSPCRS